MTHARTLYDEIFRELNFRGLRSIRDNRENYAPRKFGAIRYIVMPFRGFL